MANDKVQYGSHLEPTSQSDYLDVTHSAIQQARLSSHQLNHDAQARSQVVAIDHQEASTSKRFFAITLLFVILLSATIYLLQYNYYQVGVEWDDAQYVQLAQSLSQGRPYVVDTRFGTVLPTRYPFGFPLLLAPVYSIFHGNFQYLKALSFLATLASIGVIGWGWKYLGVSRPWLGIAVAAMYGVSPLGSTMSREVMSEPTFLFFVLIGLILVEKVANREGRGILNSVGLGLVWLFASHVRTIGIDLVACSMLYLVHKKRWGMLLPSIGAFLFGLFLIVDFTSLTWNDAFNVQWYLGEFSNVGAWKLARSPLNLIPRGIEGINAYLYYLTDSLTPFGTNPSLVNWLEAHGLSFIPEVIQLTVVTVITTGFIKNVSQKKVLSVHLFVATYSLVTLWWPFRDDRFLYGVLPFLFMYLLEGLAEAVRLGRLLLRRWPINSNVTSLLNLSGTTLLIVMLAISTARVKNWVNHERDLTVGTSWIRTNSPPDSLVVSEHNDVIYLYANRATSWLPDDTDSLASTISSHREVYLLLAPELEWSEAGTLRYSNRTQAYLQALGSGALSGQLVFSDESGMVKVYQLGRTRGGGQ